MALRWWPLRHCCWRRLCLWGIEGEKPDHEREEGGDELIWPIGMARASFKVLSVLKSVSSVARLTRMSFSAVGAALTKGTLARAATVTARKREMNIVKYRYQEVVVRREGNCWLRGDSSERGPVWPGRDRLYTFRDNTSSRPYMSTSDETKTMHGANRSHARSDGSVKSLKVEAKPPASYCMRPLSRIDLRLWEGRLRRDSSHPEKPFPKSMSRVTL